MTANGTITLCLIAIVFLPFAAGYYLSYLYRSINAPISAHLTSDLALGAADIGLLTSVYFLTFAAAQLLQLPPSSSVFSSGGGRR